VFSKKRFFVPDSYGLRSSFEKESVSQHHSNMKKTLVALLALMALLGISASFSYAKPPPPYHLTTVSWVIATRNNIGKDDRYVTLIGHVTGKDGDDYLFTDGTGTVRLDSDDVILPVGPKIVIGGRIDQAYLGFGHLEVDVQRWHYAKDR
jgi:uncharacterized protein YdeI (BOF family)